MNKKSFIAEETRKQGKISASVYLSYLKSMPKYKLIVPIILISTFLISGLPSLFKWLVSLWIADNPRVTWSVLAFVVIASVFLKILEWGSNDIYFAYGSRKLHNKMVTGFTNTYVTFFDENPTGRLLRRFSNDYVQIKSEIPVYLTDFIGKLSSIFWTIIIIFFQAPLATLTCIPSMYFYFYSQKMYRPAARELRRFSKVLESPIWSTFTETVSGYQTVRAFGRNNVFTSKLHRYFDSYIYAALAQNRLSCWLTMRLKIISESIGFVLLVIIAHECSEGKMSPGQAGFFMSLTLGMDAALQWLTRCLSSLESAMVAVERVLEYQNLPSEDPNAPIALKKQKIPTVLGKIEFKNFTMSYRHDSQKILKDFNVTFNAGEKIGIIGRTGAGKSSLFQALFRMVYRHSGTILIDDMDLFTLPLLEARNLFGIIPQEPLLFVGSLKQNLDRTEQFSEEALWQALKAVQLDRFVKNLPGKLEYQLLERGSNLSVGQRQLICMARAILYDAKIILMDEATANVDTDTDALIHSSLKNCFASKTVLIIAHRLQTVQDCDRVAMIGDGTLKSFGKPSEVLATDNDIS